MLVQIKKYTADVSEVSRLRNLSREWVKDDGFVGFDGVLGFLEQRGSFLFFGEDTDSLDEWVGVVMGNVVMDVCEIYYVYVRPEARHKGLGAKLLQHVLAFLSETSPSGDVFLEVKSQNKNAIGLYEKLGFKNIGVRKKYYSNGEDALLYKYPLQ